MRWIELTATYPEAPEDWSPIVEILGGLGCPNTLQSDVPPSIVACLLEVEGWKKHLDELKTELKASGADEITHKFIEEQNWVDAYKEHFHSRRVGQRFVITPTWEPYKAENDELVITLDPGLAFGTGDHPTTRMCLELLEAADVKGKTVADVGCGTGILSIGAILLGAKQVAGVDIEEQSVEVAKENAELNGVHYDVMVGDGLASLGDQQWDVIISNIISATLIGIAPSVRPALNEGGRWIVSGVLVDNWPDVKAAAEKHGMTLEENREEGQWIAATFIKRT
jgi:ribosomal protein L11 methyltransferase